MNTYTVYAFGQPCYTGASKQDAYFVFARKVIKANADGGTIRLVYADSSGDIATIAVVSY